MKWVESWGQRWAPGAAAAAACTDPVDVPEPRPAAMDCRTTAW